MLKIANKTFNSRLIAGTGKFSDSSKMLESIESSNAEMATLAFKRVDLKDNKHDNIVSSLLSLNVNLLPNTSGARSAKEAIFVANLAREALNTNWVKVEVHPDQRYLMPDPIETLAASKELVKQGFIVLPYCHADPVLCRLLEEAGCAAVMPLGAPIGSNMGLKTFDFLNIIIEQSEIPVIVDAGIGKPSDAALAMEIGADAVLVNTAIAVAKDPIKMGEAFKMAVQAGRIAWESGIGKSKLKAEATSPLTSFLNEL